MICDKLGAVLPAAAVAFFRQSSKHPGFWATCDKLGEIFPAAAGAFFQQKRDFLRLSDML